MEFNAQKLNDANAIVTTTFSKELIAQHLNKVAKLAAKDMNISGFRKGKIPISVVKARYGEKLNQDAEAEVFRNLFGEALAKLNIDNADVIGEPTVTKYDKKDDGSIDVEVKFSCKPVIELGDYKALIPDVEEKEVTDEEVDARISEMASSIAPLEKIKRKRAVKDGDYAVIDFEGFIDGVAFDGGKAEMHTLQIGSGSFISGFEDQVKGMKYDEEKEINVTFPKEYQSKDLAGKEAVFKVKLHEIQTKAEPVIDDEFARKILSNEKEANVQMLKEKIKEQISSEKTTRYYNEELKPVYLDKLVNTLDFDLPESVVEQEVNQAINSEARTMSEDDINKLKEDQAELEKMRERLTPDAVNSVKATFIIDALAKAENVDVSDQEVSQVLYYEAMQMGQNPQDVIKQYTDNGYLPAIKMSMIEDRVITKLLDSKLGK